jgi:hypothetical protein
MARASHRGGSRSLALYALLLKLYPTEFRRQHCAEMLQNFEDLERAASSRTALWTHIGRDLMASLIASHLKSPLARYVLGVFIAWALIFVVGYSFYGSTPGHPALHVFGGFLLGMLSMYIATRIYRPRQDGANM